MENEDNARDEQRPGAGLDWESVTSGRPFVTDLGFEPNYLQPMPDGPPMAMGRYSVFLPIEGEARHQIVEVSGDLDYLMRKYGVSDALVFKVGKPAAGTG